MLESRWKARDWARESTEFVCLGYPAPPDPRSLARIEKLRQAGLRISVLFRQDAQNCVDRLWLCSGTNHSAKIREEPWGIERLEVKHVTANMIPDIGCLVFAADAVANYSAPLGVLTPLATIQAVLASALEKVTTQHAVSTQVIEVLSESEAFSVTYYTVERSQLSGVGDEPAGLAARRVKAAENPKTVSPTPTATHFRMGLYEGEIAVAYGQYQDYWVLQNQSWKIQNRNLQGFRTNNHTLGARDWKSLNLHLGCLDFIFARTYLTHKTITNEIWLTTPSILPSCVPQLHPLPTRSPPRRVSFACGIPGFNESDGLEEDAFGHRKKASGSTAGEDVEGALSGEAQDRSWKRGISFRVRDVWLGIRFLFFCAYAKKFEVPGADMTRNVMIAVGMRWKLQPGFW
ncbi:hypothetical protein C8R45DRAFT_942797 [Mycena sanguinolenta]|nr:hypothetical protein C8R45DRAFT_942797 [Mycena sanguinolenta]